MKWIDEFFYNLFSGRQYIRPNDVCEDDPSKRCPYRYYFTHDGTIGVDMDDRIACCKFRKQLDAFDRIYQLEKARGTKVHKVRLTEPNE